MTDHKVADRIPQGYQLFMIESWWEPWLDGKGAPRADQVIYYATGADGDVIGDGREDTVIYTVIAWEIPEGSVGLVWEPVSAEVGHLGWTTKTRGDLRLWATEHSQAREVAMDLIKNRRRRAQALLKELEQ